MEKNSGRISESFEEIASKKKAKSLIDRIFLIQGSGPKRPRKLESILREMQ